VLIYHNITPARFFSGFSQELAGISLRGREELESLVSHVSLVLADSEYNRQQIQKIGFKRTEVFPLFIDFAKYQKPHSEFLYDVFRDDRTNILFVGRIAPNKKIEDLIRVTFYFKKYISPLVRLIVVGKTSTIPKYYESLIRLADEFYLKPEEICFTGHIPDEEMFALYKASDVFLSMSEHEGFGLPFIEGLIFDLPVIAYECCAVPFTLEEAGVLLKDKRVEYVAELVAEVARQGKLREEIIQGQRSRLERFKELELDKVLEKKLKALME
jgi:glycosyltransferase involved in cell wall biosynthesis